MDNQTVINKTKEHIANTYGRYDVAIQRGSGARCTDFDGKEYIDFTSGIGVNSLGFCNETWALAVSRQAQTLNHTSNLYYTEPGALLAERLCKATGMKKAFFSNSGAEANEGAIKAARKYSYDKYGSGRYEIVTLVNSFHGRTLATITATGQDVFHQFFDPFVEGFRYAKANDIDDVLDKVNDQTCAIMIEVIQGEGGILTLEGDFLNALDKLAKERDILLIVDEVQTGIGRTGTLFAYSHFDLMPNIVTAAKGLGGGLPIGAILFDEKTQNVLSPGTHATTYGANPICCAGANAVLDYLTDDKLRTITQNNTMITDYILHLPHVKSVSGLGLMIGIEIDIDNQTVVKKCIEKGLLVLTAKHKIRLLPPLNITAEEIDAGLAILKDVLHSI
jgi:acetylornithine/N-succinyldiaminopimelate aminotransferase